MQASNSGLANSRPFCYSHVREPCLGQHASDMFLHVLETLDDHTLYEVVPLVCQQWHHADLTPRLLVHLFLGTSDRCSPVPGGRPPRRITRGSSRRAWRLPVVVLPSYTVIVDDDTVTIDHDGNRRRLLKLPATPPSLDQLLARCSGLQRRPTQAGVRWLDICANRGEEQAIEYLALASSVVDFALAELRLELDDPTDQDLRLPDYCFAPFFGVTSLDLRLGLSDSQAPVNVHDWDWLVELLPRFAALQTLRWECADWRDKWVEQLMRSLAQLPLQGLTLVIDDIETLCTRELEPLRGHATLRHLAVIDSHGEYLNLHDDGGGKNGEYLLHLLSTLPSLESVLLPGDWVGRTELKLPLADFLGNQSNLRSLGVVHDAITNMYWPHAEGAEPADLLYTTNLWSYDSRQRRRDSQQPWAEEPLGGYVWTSLSEAQDDPEASNLYSRCCIAGPDESPVPNTSLWRLLRVPTVTSPFEFHNVVRPYALQHLRVTVNSPNFTYLADLARACAHSFPLLKTLQITMLCCQLPNVEICAALWWLAKPPPTPAGKLRLQHLTIIIGTESAQGAAYDEDKDVGFCPTQLEYALDRYFGRGGACTCVVGVSPFSPAANDPDDARKKKRFLELLETGVHGCCDARHTRRREAGSGVKLPWRWW